MKRLIPIMLVAVIASALVSGNVALGEQTRPAAEPKPDPYPYSEVTYYRRGWLFERRWRKHLQADKRVLRLRISRLLARRARARLPRIDSCLYELIKREGTGFRLEDPSTWQKAATTWNHEGSGAYGIPQALPGSKMRSQGSDWRTNPATQIRWMISYVNNRYGGSCAALSHHRAVGSY